MASHSDFKIFLKGTGLWVARELDSMDESARDVFEGCCAEVLVHLAAGISEIIAKRDS